MNNTNVTNKAKRNWVLIGVIIFAGIIVVMGVVLALMSYLNRPQTLPPEQNLVVEQENWTTIAQVEDNVQVAPEIAEPVIVKDSDSDGLNDEEEAQYRTNPGKPDTDNDGLFDGEEVKFYKTNPLISDSDADGFLDGEEIRGGYNPLGPGKLLNFEEAIGKVRR